MKPPTLIEPSELAPSRRRKPLRHLLTALAVVAGVLLTAPANAAPPVTSGLKLSLDASGT